MLIPLANPAPPVPKRACRSRFATLRGKFANGIRCSPNPLCSPKMRIAIICNDTRGGVQPYVALGAGMRRAGHEVQAVAPAEFAPMFAQAGLPLAPLSGGSNPQEEAALRGGGGAAERGMIATMRLMARELPARIHGWVRETLAGCEGAEVLTGGVGGMVAGLAVAEKLGVPFIETHLQPVGAPTAAYPGVLLAGTPRWLGGYGRRLSHHLSEAAVWMPFRGPMVSARAQVLGLEGRGGSATAGQPVLYGFSPRVLGVPARSGGRARHVTGYWTLPAAANWNPPPDLEAFLARGDGRPVVSIGFGSMASQDPAALTALVREAVRRAGVRAVLLSGWGGLGGDVRAGPALDEVFCVEAVPHDWLLPRVAAAVHHGGAGTTGAALRAGVPAVVVPFTVDQPFWGARVAHLGVGPTPIPRRRLSAGRLAEALRRTVTDEGMHTRAANLGAALRAEDGVAVAVGHFGRLRLKPNVG